MANPKGVGGFQKGVSGNPGGRPKVVEEVQELARQHTTEAVQTLVAIMTDVDQPAPARVSAANAILDRGFGKPPQSLNHEVKSLDPIAQLMEQVGRNSKPLVNPTNGAGRSAQSTRPH